MSAHRRRYVTLLMALTFLVLAVSGVLAFIQQFSIQIVGLHSLMGFLFIALAFLHIQNNFRPLKKYTQSKIIWVCLAIVATLTVIFTLQPKPVKMVLGLSKNLGPALDRFETHDNGMIYQYAPSPSYSLELNVKSGASYTPQSPPHIAIWLENQGAYHIKTLHAPDESGRSQLPYWNFKVAGWEKAKRDAESADATEVDGVSGATPNGSFDPADYILPASTDNVTPYKLLIEINQPRDAHGSISDQPSLVYSVEIDNSHPQTFQLLELMGYPKREDEEDKEAWALYYVDERFGSALQLLDSSLLTIERSPN